MIIDQSNIHLLKVGMSFQVKVLKRAYYTDVANFEKHIRVISGIHNAYFDCSCATSYNFRDPLHYLGTVYVLIIDDLNDVTNNSKRSTCYKCGCSTEKRRDFLDFSIREFCPRCKI